MIPPMESSTVFKTRGPLDPVADRAIYVPRPELDQLLRAVQAPAVDAYLAILSSRQTGKTTLLYQFRAHLRSRSYGVALIDLGVVRDQTEAELYHFVATEMLSELETYVSLPRQRRGREGPGVALPSNAVQFRAFLLEVARQAQTTRIVVLIDEVEAISEKHADAFFGTLRNVFSSRRKEDEAAFEKYLFVVCGAKELHRLTTGPNSPMNIAERIYLQDFKLDGVCTLTANFARAAIVAPEETARWIFDQTSGHPYLTQQLCATVEQWRPGVITQELVQRAAVQMLKSDDHLAKMLLQVDADSAVRQTLEKIAGGQKVPFSRLQPQVAQLELLGAIRDAGNCAIRNPIYYAAIRAHFNLTGGLKERGRRWLRFLIAFLLLAFCILNIPFLYNYARDLYWAPRSVNDRFAAQTLGTSFVIHYDRVLSANDPAGKTISVEMEGAPAAPLYVTLQFDQKDLALDGNARRLLDQPFQNTQFKFTMNQTGVGGLRYNPLEPATDHRQVRLLFQLKENAAQTETYTADFLVDYNSAFILSAVASVASFIGSLGTIFARMANVRSVMAWLGKLAAPPNP